MKCFLNKIIILVILSGILLPSCRKKNKPPYTPYTPSGPSWGLVGISYKFNSLAIDPDGDSVAVRFDWGDGDTSEWSFFNLSGQTIFLSNAWNDSCFFYIKAQAIDIRGLMSEWSLSHLIKIDTGLNQPPNASIPYGTSTGFLEITYEFLSSACDPENDIVAIRFDWGDGDTSDWSSWVRNDSSVLMTHYWSYPGLYNVKAQAMDIDSLTSEWTFPHQILISKERLKWRYRISNQIPSSPAIATDGTIYVGAFDGYLYALNPDGTLKWHYNAESEVGSPPTIGSDGTIYVGAFNGFLYAFNPDGTLKWKKNLQDAPNAINISSSPAIGNDNIIYVPVFWGYFYAIKPDGVIKWVCRDTVFDNGSPAIGSDGTIYCGTRSQGTIADLFAINPDGTFKWCYHTGGRVVSSPAIGSDGTIYVGSGDDYLYAVNPDGSLKWRFGADAPVYSSPSISSDGTIYFGSNDYNLYAINPDGTLKWRFETGQCDISSPAIGSDGTIYIGSHDCYIYAINSDGTLKWRYKTMGCVNSSPAIGSDGTIYIGAGDGYLYALCGAIGLALTPWPMFHHDVKHTGRVDNIQR